MRKRGAAREARKDNLLAAQARCRRLTAQLEDRERRLVATEKQLALVARTLEKQGQELGLVVALDDDDSPATPALDFAKVQDAISGMHQGGLKPAVESAKNVTFESASAINAAMEEDIMRHIDRKRIEKLAHSMIEAALDMLRAPR